MEGVSGAKKMKTYDLNRPLRIGVHEYEEKLPEEEEVNVELSLGLSLNVTEERKRRKECMEKLKNKEIVGGGGGSSSGGATLTAQMRLPSDPQPFVQEPRMQRPTIGAPGRDTTDINERLRKALDNMPLVSALGVGPNCVKVEGFLYRYNSKEGTKIVCVCHGDFLTPAEFVMHGGGVEVDNPLSHINVSSFSIM